MDNNVEQGHNRKNYDPCVNESKVHYLQGDATKPVDVPGYDNKIIAHICNDLGGWGAGFVLALSKMSKRPENFYRSSYAAKNNAGLGCVQFVPLTEYDGITVANMVAQHGYKNKDNPVPLVYEALRECLSKVKKFAIKNNATVHMPKIGCGLAGGDWGKIEQIIIQELCNYGVPVYVYEFNNI